MGSIFIFTYLYTVYICPIYNYLKRCLDNHLVIYPTLHWWSICVELKRIAEQVIFRRYVIEFISYKNVGFLFGIENGHFIDYARRLRSVTCVLLFGTSNILGTYAMLRWRPYVSRVQIRSRAHVRQMSLSFFFNLF